MNEAEDDGYLMANLPPRLTGLPMIVWVSERGNARHDVRIKVNPTHGSRVDHANLATVAVRPVPRLVAGRLAAADLTAVSDWIRRNESVILDYWEGRIYTDELLARLQRIP
jgi:hypothetical protein